MLDPQSMANSIKASLTAAGFKPTHEKCPGDAYWLAISTGIINHIKADAVVPVTGGSSSGNYKVT